MKNEVGVCDFHAVLESRSALSTAAHQRTRLTTVTSDHKRDSPRLMARATAP